MKYFLLSLILILSIDCLAQDSKARSKAGALFPIPEPVAEEQPNENLAYQLPFLSATVDFSETSGNNVLDAGEEGKIHLIIKNEGERTAKNCRLNFEPILKQKNITIQFNEGIGNILPGQTVDADIILSATNTIETGLTKYALNIYEENGFDLDPGKVITIPSREFQPPNNVVVDYGIVDYSNRNSKIEKFEIVDVTFRIQNRGETISHGTYAKVNLGENVVNMDVPEIFEIGELMPGEYKDITAKIATNARTKEVNLSVNIYEETGVYPSFKSFELPFDVVQKGVEEIRIAEIEQPTFEIPNVANLDFNLASNIPSASQKRERAVAVIIGNKNYQNPAVPAVDYAINDAALMKNYVIQALGYEEENILYYSDASLSDFVNIFGQPNDYKGRLYDYAVNGNEIFVYYSGHGAPNPDNNQGYIVPVDCDPNEVRLNGYSLETLFGNLDKIAYDKKLSNVTVVLESCFSGNTQRGSLLKNISPVYINIKNHTMAYPKSTVFTSAHGNEVSTWYEDKKQSLFTYYFLLGLKGDADSDNNDIITAKELYDFTADEVNGVPYWSRRLNNYSQHPTFGGRDDYEVYK